MWIYFPKQSSNKQQTQTEMDNWLQQQQQKKNKKNYMKQPKQISGKFCNIYRVIENTLTAFK